MPIKLNPFRVLGLPGNSTEKELQKRIGVIKRYAEVGKTKTFDFDFDFLGDSERTVDQINYAKNRIEQDHNKIHHSLFWFVKVSQYDEIAFNNLRENNTDKAIEIWSKTLRDEITEKNYASYHNISTLYMALSTKGGELELEMFKEGVSIKAALLYSGEFRTLLGLITGNDARNDPDKISKGFIDEIVYFAKPYIGVENGIETRDLIELFDSFPSNIIKYVLSKFTDLPVSNVEKNIEKTKNDRKERPSVASAAGLHLYKVTKDDVGLLRRLLGVSDIHYKMITNNVASEILQCSIDYFNENRDEAVFDAGEEALKVIGCAKKIGATGQVKKRIEENEEIIQEWVDEKPEREKYERVSGDLESIGRSLENFQNLTDSIQNAKSLISSCEPKLLMIKAVLGRDDDLYLQVSGAVVEHSLGMTIQVVNKAQEDVGAKRKTLSSLTATIASTASLLTAMSRLDMSNDVRQRFNENKKILEKIGSSLQSINGSGGTSGGCYVATMAYGSYDHPKVMILRKYRDEKLSKTRGGRLIVRLYYNLSPYCVAVLADKKRINHFIRKILDKVVEVVK